ncbi:MAG: hypothetical protein WA414_15285 [Acidobacteriaceae bacterium]
MPAVVADFNAVLHPSATAVDDGNHFALDGHFYVADGSWLRSRRQIPIVASHLRG